MRTVGLLVAALVGVVASRAAGDVTIDDVAPDTVTLKRPQHATVVELRYK